MSFYSAEELREAEDTFHKQYGMTLAQWATIEQRMFYWFHYASDLPEDMARGVFYSSKNFNGRVDMMEAAVDSSAVVAAPSKIAVTALIKRCRAYSTFRNKITHGEPHYDFRKDSATYRQMLLIEGKNLKEHAAGDAISLDYLAWGCDQLRGLSKLILEALHASQEKHEKRLEECVAELQTLPGGLYPNPRTQKK